MVIIGTIGLYCSRVCKDGLKHMKKIFIIISLTALGLVLLLSFSSYLERGYIRLFNKTAIVARHNLKGQIDGEVYNYIEGKIKSTVIYKNGIREGWLTTYFKNGGVQNRTLYINNEANGRGFEFYANGKLKYSGNWKDGKIFGNVNWYNIQGNLVSYMCYDRFEDKFCQFTYGSNNKISKMEGFVISTNIYSIDTTNKSIVLMNNHTLHNNRYRNIKDLYITVAQPARLFQDLTITINNHVYRNHNLRYNTFKICNAFGDKGVYEITINSHLLDNKRNAVNGLIIKTLIVNE
jgi:hypothetical protein